MKPAFWKIANLLCRIVMTIFILMSIFGSLVSIGAMFELESYQANYFGITSNTFHGAAICLVISLFFMILSYKGYRVAKKHNQSLDPTWKTPVDSVNINRHAGQA